MDWQETSLGCLASQQQASGTGPARTIGQAPAEKQAARHSAITLAALSPPNHRVPVLSLLLLADGN